MTRPPPGLKFALVLRKIWFVPLMLFRGTVGRHYCKPTLPDTSTNPEQEVAPANVASLDSWGQAGVTSVFLSGELWSAQAVAVCRFSLCRPASSSTQARIASWPGRCFHRKRQRRREGGRLQCLAKECSLGNMDMTSYMSER